MADISRNIELLGRNFALHSGTTQSMCLQNIIGISVKLRALDPSQRFKHTFWILDPPPLAAAASMLSKTYKSHTHVGPDNKYTHCTVNNIQACPNTNQKQASPTELLILSNSLTQPATGPPGLLHETLNRGAIVQGSIPLCM